MKNQVTATKEPEVECNHKPGEVWADGCCTSKKNKAQQHDENTKAGVVAEATEPPKSESFNKE